MKKKQYYVLFLCCILAFGQDICFSGPGEMLLRELPDATDKLPQIFPLPSEIKISEGEFRIDLKTKILIPQEASGQDRFLAGLISAELADKYELPVMISKKNSLIDAERFILIGDITNPLVKSYCARNRLSGVLESLGEEGYFLELNANMRQFNMEIIPELPSLTHAYYLLAGHEELAENMDQPVPDTYCPLKPGIYDLYFDVLDEYIEVIHPKIIHIGHDEWRMEKDLCELCRGKDYGELYAADVRKIHEYLAGKGIKVALWGDHLLESVTEKEFRTWKSSTGYQYRIPGALRPEQVLKLMPKDILVFNWFWDEPANDRQISEFGFRQIYGNLRADIAQWEERQNIKGLLGGAPSSWAATTELNFGKDQLVDFLGCSKSNIISVSTPILLLLCFVQQKALILSISSALSGKIQDTEKLISKQPVWLLITPMLSFFLA